jgi:Uncharacterized conserved protein
MAREMKVVCYNPEWARLFENERKILLDVFGELLPEIHHFGSTAIEKMFAKPTIDIMAVVSDIEQVDLFNDSMCHHGYIPKGENGIEKRRYFVKLNEDGENHAVHVHIYEKGNSHIASELMFRDFLRIDEDSFNEYESMKKRVSKQFLHSPGEYEDAKSECVMRIMDRAKVYYGFEGNKG